MKHYLSYPLNHLSIISMIFVNEMLPESSHCQEFNKFITSKKPEFYFSGIKQFVSHWQKCSCLHFLFWLKQLHFQEIFAFAVIGPKLKELLHQPITYWPYVILLFHLSSFGWFLEVPDNSITALIFQNTQVFFRTEMLFRKFLVFFWFLNHTNL